MGKSIDTDFQRCAYTDQKRAQGGKWWNSEVTDCGDHDQVAKCVGGDIDCTVRRTHTCTTEFNYVNVDETGKVSTETTDDDVDPIKWCSKKANNWEEKDEKKRSYSFYVQEKIKEDEKINYTCVILKKDPTEDQLVLQDDKLFGAVCIPEAVQAKRDMESAKETS